MNLLDAARSLVRRFPGGIEAVAVRLDKNPSTLRHEVAGSDAYKLGIQDAELLTQMAIEQGVDNPMQILNIMATNCGALVVPLPGLQRGPASTFEDLAGAAKEFADFIAATSSAVADGKVSGNELREVDRELAELIGRVQQVRNGLAAMHEAGKPVPSTVQRQSIEQWCAVYDKTEMPV
jgi:hypothetical protein